MPNRDVAWSLAKFLVINDWRTTFLRVLGKVYTNQLPLGERVMYEHIAVPTDKLNQRWDFRIWIGEIPMVEEYIILKENRIEKAMLLHRVPRRSS